MITYAFKSQAEKEEILNYLRAELKMLKDDTRVGYYSEPVLDYIGYIHITPPPRIKANTILNFLGKINKKYN